MAERASVCAGAAPLRSGGTRPDLPVCRKRSAAAATAGEGGPLKRKCAAWVAGRRASSAPALGVETAADGADEADESGVGVGGFTPWPPLPSPPPTSGRGGGASASWGRQVKLGIYT